MADRTSAGLFGWFFAFLADSQNITITKEEMAEFLWEQTCSYDFSPCQMCADEALEKLGLATPCEVCECTVYKGEEDDHPYDCEGED